MQNLRYQKWWMMHIKPERKYFLHHYNQMTAVDLNVWGRIHSEDISKIMWCKKNLVTTTIVFIFIRVNQGCYVHRDWNITFLIIEKTFLVHLSILLHTKRQQKESYLGNNYLLLTTVKSCSIYENPSKSDSITWTDVP